MEGLVQYLDVSFASGSVVSLLIMFGVGFTLSFNPRIEGNSAIGNRGAGKAGTADPFCSWEGTLLP